MADQTIGVARIEITADGTGALDATAKVKAGIEGMSKDAQAAYSKLTAAQKRSYGGCQKFRV